MFYSNIAKYVPMVSRSERAFTGFLNEMRLGASKAAYNSMIQQGATGTQLNLMGRFINIASGRGVLPANLEKFAPALNVGLFSAKYQMSTLQMPRQMARMILSKDRV